MAEKTQLTEWEKTLVWRLRANQNGLVVNTLEEDRVILSILTCAQYITQIGLGPRPITRWSEVSTLRITVSDKVEYTYATEHMGLFKMISSFVGEVQADSQGNPVLDSDGKTTPTMGILILADIQKTVARDSNVVRLLRESMARIKKEKMYKTIIILGDAFTLPAELRTEFTVLEFDVPTTAQVYSTLSNLIAFVRERGGEAYAHIAPSKELIKVFAMACTGLTESEIKSLVSSVIAKFGTIDSRGVQFAQQEKARVLLRGGALSIRTPRGGMEMVGGMEGVKEWVNGINSLIKSPEKAKEYGLKIPSGLLLVGVSGGGKSLMAEALGGHWQLPVLLFDVGATFGSLVGESEANVRRMQSVANAMKPCIVFVDEIEKGLGGDGMDGGTSSRVKQSLLTWLNDKDPEIFVVATANDLSKLNQLPELTRAGRFDAQFFVDLPSASARLEILKIHLAASRHPLKDEDLAEVVRITHGYSGAEIEAIVQDALRLAFNQQPRLEHPTTQLLVECTRKRKPLSVTMEDSISNLRKLVKDGRIMSAGSSMESDLRNEFVASEQISLQESEIRLPQMWKALDQEGE